LVWRDGHGLENQFSVAKVWDDIRERQQHVCWSRVVWFHRCILRHEFYMWLVFKGKHNTQDRMKTWDIHMMCCALCTRDLDSHKHLFFERDLSKQVWSLVRFIIDMDDIRSDWKEIIG